jgi:succinate dehydrogenase/fumarate reductase cytochrome b subunit
LKILFIVGFLAVIVYNLGAGLYYLIVDKGRSKRAVNALSWRIGLSVALVLLLVAGMASGLVQPHGIYG